MNVMGIYDTNCHGQMFETLGARSEYLRIQADMGENEDLLTDARFEMVGEKGDSNIKEWFDDYCSTFPNEIRF